jgi:1-acyl-sn-glycerol-3-phosphate acyltransferase
MSLANTARNAQYEFGIYARPRYIDACQTIANGLGLVACALLVRRQNVTLKASDVHGNNKYVVVANHQTYMDPWMVMSLISMTMWRQIGMPRALVANRFFNYPVLGTYLRSMGSFPAKPHPTDPYGLEYAEYLLSHHKSIVIFPEGHITLNRQNPARRGVMELAHMPNVHVIPVHLEWARPRWKGRLEIGIGKPFDGSKMIAQEILDRVYDTPTR